MFYITSKKKGVKYSVCKTCILALVLMKSMFVPIGMVTVTLVLLNQMQGKWLFCSVKYSNIKNINASMTPMDFFYY